MINLSGFFEGREPDAIQASTAREYFEMARGYFTMAKSDASRLQPLNETLLFLEYFFQTIGWFEDTHFNKSFYIDMNNIFSRIRDKFSRLGVREEEDMAKDLARHCLYASFLEKD